jgi:UDP-N-acetylmuramoyl-tripeptide--D-alanyl-D-alanine ligase
MNELYQHFLKSSGITTDSRNVQQNSIFFALKGEHFNGNLFAADALAQGAKLAVVDDPELRDKTGCLFTEDAYLTLVELAKFHRKQLKCPVIAITGTNGKTTTKELTVSVLSTKYNVAYTKGNLNNHIGVPLTILSANQETEILVVEMGANHQGDIRFLCGIAAPDYGLITNIGKAHLEGFGSTETIFLTKTELFESVRQNGKGIFLNADDERLTQAAAEKTVSSFGIQNGKITGKVTENVPFLQMVWTCDDRTYQQPTNLFGAYNAGNILASVAAGIYFDIQPEQIISSIASYIPQNNRSQFIITPKNNNIVLDAYNANPSSMKLALEEFSILPGTPKIAILGEMMELGRYRQEEHLSLLNLMKMHQFDKVYLVGAGFRQFEKQFPEFYFFESTSTLFEHLTSEKPVNDAYIIIKGSRANALEKLTDCL